MNGNITAAEYPLSKIFSSDFEYIIPSYQRPYSWGIEQAAALFDDLFDFYNDENAGDYFLGSIVLIKTDLNKYDVIDGQQRLTTLTILMSALAFAMPETQRANFSKYIVEPGNELEGLVSKPRLTLRDRDKKFFGDYIQELNLDELSLLDNKGLDNESQVHIKENAILFKEKIQQDLKNNEELIKKFTQFLVQKCYLVSVSTLSQQLAFRVFSVMNSRGLDLLPTDIIKADLIGKIENEEKKADYNKKWETLEVELDRNIFNDLFNYIRMISAKVKAKRSLLEEFKSYINEENFNTECFIDEKLIPYGQALDTIKNCNFEATSQSEIINEYLSWLNRIDNSDWMPVAIYAFVEYKNNVDKLAILFKKLERLAAYMHISSYNVNERIDRYSKILNALDTKNYANIIRSLDLTKEEASRLIETLNGNIYHLVPRRRNYLILRLDSFLSDQAASYNSQNLTIEHVLPQTLDENSQWAEWWPDNELKNQWVHKLANLLPLNRRRNSSAQNYDFDRKKKAYFLGKNSVSSFVLTTQVLNESIWNIEVLKKRQESLINTLKENWEIEIA